MPLPPADPIRFCSLAAGAVFGILQKGLRLELTEFRRDTNERLEKIEERLDYLAEKWMEHDQEISKIKRRQA